MTILAALMIVLTLAFVGLVLVYVLRFMANLVDKNHAQQLELTHATTDRVITVVRETAKAVGEAIAPPSLDTGSAYEVQPNLEQEITPGEFEEVPWFLRKDGNVGVDPTDALDPWTTGLAGDVGRVANIRPGEDILPGANIPTNLPGLSRPNMAGEQY